jgi:hypothetical protein
MARQHFFAFARMDTFVNTARDEIRKLRSEDVVVIWGGAMI